MSYTEEDARLDELYDTFSKELYPEHKEQAIEEFIEERLQSYFIKNPEVALPAMHAYSEANELFELKHYSAALVFYATSIEQFLKFAILKPIVYGLLHNEALAEVIVDLTLKQTGIERYKNLIEKIFEKIVSTDVNTIKRTQSQKPILLEISEVQDVRNKIIHKGYEAIFEEAEKARNVTSGIFFDVLVPLLDAISLKVVERAVIVKK